MMEKKKENYKYAKRIGLLIVIVGTVLSTLSSITAADLGSETSKLISIPYLYILPFVVEAFYPYPEEWGIVRKAWSCLCHGLFRLLVYFVLAFAIAVGLLLWKAAH